MYYVKDDMNSRPYVTSVNKYILWIDVEKCRDGNIQIEHQLNTEKKKPQANDNYLWFNPWQWWNI